MQQLHYIFLKKETSISGFIFSWADFYRLGADPKSSFSGQQQVLSQLASVLSPLPFHTIVSLHVTVGKLDFLLTPLEFVASW